MGKPCRHWQVGMVGRSGKPCPYCEIERNRAVMAETVEVLQDFVGNDETPEPNCSCHLCPPCGDCVDHGWMRELMKNAVAAIAKYKEATQKT